MRKSSAGLAAMIAAAALAMPLTSVAAPLPAAPRRRATAAPIWRRRKSDPLQAEREAWNEAVDKRNAERTARRNERRMQGGFTTLVAAVIMVVLGLLTLWASTLECKAQWAESGLSARYSLSAGCMVRRADGAWIPSSAVRDVPLQAPATPVAEGIPR